MQVMIGTLESLLRGKPAATLQQEAPAPQAVENGLGPRVEALETQVGAMTHQLERIGQQLTRIEARLSDDAPQSLTPPDEEEAPPPLRQGQAPDDPSDTGSIYGDTSKPRWFGPPPGAGDSAEQGQAEEPAQTMMTALPAADAQTLYQQAYGDFMQADYPSAEAGFRQFLGSYPKDALAGSAQYWLGESYYARGEYKNAADAFLKGYKTYKRSDKAPDTLLKLAMSLAALGQKDAACSTFGELDTKFPRAPEALRDEAKDERAKAGC
jgi:tol-pal system protein YbgF